MKQKAETMTARQLASYIDYSILKPEFLPQEIVQLTLHAVKLGCKTVCINGYAIDLVKPIVNGTETEICVVCDFPFGASLPESRLAQVETLLAHPEVTEIDIVLNMGYVREGNIIALLNDLDAIVKICHKNKVLVKCIFETDALTETQIREVIEVCITVNADYIKTSTGFFTGKFLYDPHQGGFREMIQLMLEGANGKIKVKASGAIRDRKHFLDLIDLGVNRLGIGYRSVDTVLNMEEKQL